MSDALARPIALVIDDELEIRRFLRVSLNANGYDVRGAATGADGVAQAATLRPEIIILDIGLPDIGGLEVLLRLRAWSRVPVIALSARHGESDKIAMLDAGANDYLTKPFSVGELMARIRAARRATLPASESSSAQVGPLRIDFAAREVTLNDAPLKLTKSEYALLRMLAENLGKVLTHRQLLRGGVGTGVRA